MRSLQYIAKNGIEKYKQQIEQNNWYKNISDIYIPMFEFLQTLFTAINEYFDKYINLTDDEDIE
jgi:hypothetical protein